jgi:hypothetical protein
MQQVLPLGSTVIVLKKMQGSVWREAGRTGKCPTPDWLRESYGTGEYELRLKAGNRVLCMVGVDTERTPKPSVPESGSSKPARARFML